MKKDNFYSKLSIILTTLSSAVLNICEYVFNVSSIFVCPKNLATNVTLAPLLINNDVHECLKLCNLIDFNPALFAIKVLLSYIVVSLTGLASDTAKKSSLKLQYSFLDCS